MWTKAFWKDASERAVKTFAQVMGAEFTIVLATPYEADWSRVAVFAAVAVGYSVFTSISSKKVGHPETAALLKPEYKE